jgi:lipopolysaccharide/colanic/teichoic acid biosynthesis glycosyltransferase
MTDCQRFVKRLFDISLSLVGLLSIGWIIVIVFFIASIDTKNNGFFLQKRVGKNGKFFKILKIRTMRFSKYLITTVTISGDSRITVSGTFFRKWKIDELPQLVNILLGQMSFVGPRPDVPGYANKLQGDDRIVLSVRPGITGPAQLTYRNEEDILSDQIDVVRYNDEVIWPDKVKINKDYVKNYSFLKDIYYIWKTIVGGNVKY